MHVGSTTPVSFSFVPTNPMSTQHILMYFPITIINFFLLPTLLPRFPTTLNLPLSFWPSRQYRLLSTCVQIICLFSPTILDMFV